MMLTTAGETKGLGAYSQYSLANEYISFKVPQSISSAEAATVPLASATAWLALFSKGSLQMDRQAGKDTAVLVWGGSCTYHLVTLDLNTSD
jgi:NADPH:quinone reductase-like Zn-dependent oxidoreductase